MFSGHHSYYYLELITNREKGSKMSADTGFFERIGVGTEVQPLVKDITRRQLFMYSATTWDLHPGHYDRAFAQSQGFQDVYLDGPMDAAFMAQLITDWISLNGTLKQLGLTYRGMAFPGDTLTCMGKVTKKYIKEDTKFIEIEIELKNQSGKLVATGSATVTLFS